MPLPPPPSLLPPPQALAFASRAVHAGERAAFPGAAPATTPIYASTSFCYDDPHQLDAVLGGEAKGFAYSRYGNPTVAALEAAIASLEGTEAAVCVSSGMAALHLALLSELQAGDAVVAATDLYGSTTALLQTVFGSLGVRTRLCDVGDLPSLEVAVAEVRPRVVLVETLSNPLVRVADIPRIAEISRAVGATLIVDNTFATPYLVTPAAHGADVVVHSTTKFLGGHGDVTGGAVCTTAERAETVVHMHRLSGAVPSPFDAWLTLRGLKTLPLRMARQSENAAIVTAALAAHPKIANVHYPSISPLPEGEGSGVRANGTPSLFHTSHRGGMAAFEIAGAGRDEVLRFLAALRMVRPATTLGDVYSLVLYPAMSTHRDLSPQELAAAGIGPGLLRLSTGIEDPGDIVADLERALEAV